MEGMAEAIRLRIELEDDGIIVTLPGTTFHVMYRKPNQSPGLVAFDEAEIDFVRESQVVTPGSKRRAMLPIFHRKHFRTLLAQILC